MKKKIFASFILLLTIATTAWGADLLYAVAASGRIKGWLTLYHNIFNVVIDFPVTWSWGIVWEEGVPVMLLQPSDQEPIILMQPNEHVPIFTDQYRCIVISTFPAIRKSVKKELDHRLSIFKQNHLKAEIKFTSEPNLTQRYAYAICFWESIEGFTIMEEIKIYPLNDDHFTSITVRTTKSIAGENFLELEKIVNSYTGIRTKLNFNFFLEK
jgi:hypothetical protein